MDNKFICTRCGGLLTMNEYKNNICLCDGCWIELRQKENISNIYWNEIKLNNVDEILERKRSKQLKENNHGQTTYYI